ncbi:MAG TPA: LptF/LptG family permease, partial [Candidatus Paceibacterota bacterium]
MRTRIINRYLLTELIAPFFLGLSVFVFILMMSQILRLNELIIVHGVGVWATMKLVFYLITAFLAISIPIAFLFSVLSLFGRLSADSELIALRVSGFSLIQLAAPVIAFAVMVCIFCLFLTLHVEAWGAKAYKVEISKIGREKATIGVQPGVFNDDFFGLVLYAAKVDSKEKKLEDVFIYDDSDPSSPLSVIARQGAIVSSADLPSVFLVLENGTIHS